jgi:hypothetical protein
LRFHERSRSVRGRATAVLGAGALVAAGVVMTATADPGPPTTVKAAQYGNTTPKPVHKPSGKCASKKLKKADQNQCQVLKESYQRGLAACAKMKTKSQRAKCKAQQEKYIGKSYRDFLKKHHVS